MLKHSFVMGVDHQRTSLEIREKLRSVSFDVLASKCPYMQELMVLSTCNRFEIYSSAEDDVFLENLLKEITNHTHISYEELTKVFYKKHGEEMLRHGFGVAASLRSMVLGEPQILGQMKQSYLQSKRAGKMHGLMDRFCTTALRVGKRVRSETLLGKSAVSIASQAVHLIAQKLDGKGTVLVVGAGDMVKSALTHFMHHPNIDIILCNRTFEHAQSLAARFPRVKAVCYEGLWAHVKNVDAVLSSTSSSAPIFTTENLGDMLGDKPLVMVDIAVPRDVEKQLGLKENIDVYDIDMLGEIVMENLKDRQGQVQFAEGIIEEEIQAFVSWNDERKNVHMVDHMRSYMENLRSEVLKNNPNIGAEEATRLLLNKIMHHPSLVLKSGEIPAEAMENALSMLFGVACPRVRLLPIRGKSAKTSTCPFKGFS